MQGDGISPEITAATLGVLRAAAAKWQIEFAFDEVEVGLKPLQPQGHDVSGERASRPPRPPTA